MTAFWRTFWWCIASFGALVALYIGAAAEDLEWAFWVVLGGSGAVAGFVAFRPYAVQWSTAVRNYPSLLRRAAELQSQVSGLDRRLAATVETTKSHWDRGFSEGIATAYGALKANATRPPKIIGIAMEDGIPLILARCHENHFIVGARYDVEVIASGNSRGVVEAQRFDSDRKVAAMALVLNSSERFWQEFERRAEFESGPPSGVRLRPTQLVGEWQPDTASSAGTTNIEEMD